METPGVKTTTFIPKKSSVTVRKRRKRLRAIFMPIAVFLLLAVLLAWGGFLGYREVLKRQRGNLELELAEASQANIDLALVNDLRKLDNRLTTVGGLLSAHVTLAPLFVFLEEMTLTNSVRFSDIDYRADEDGQFAVTLSGFASDFDSLAYQADLLKEQQEEITSVTFDSFAFDEESGNVSFTLKFVVRPNLVSYEEAIGQNAGNIFSGLEDVDTTTP